MKKIAVEMDYFQLYFNLNGALAVDIAADSCCLVHARDLYRKFVIFLIAGWIFLELLLN